MRDREGDRERQEGDRESERQKGIVRDRQTDREAERQRGREAETKRQRQRDILRYMDIVREGETENDKKNIATYIDREIERDLF